MQESLEVAAVPKITIGEFNKIIRDELPWAHDM
jgi:hypothetical protein